MVKGLTNHRKMMVKGPLNHTKSMLVKVLLTSEI